MKKFDFKNAGKKELHEQYKIIADATNDHRFFTKKELNHLPEALMDGEQVLAFTSGHMDGNTWLITLTDRRILFLDKGLLWGLKQESIPLNKVNSVTGATRIMFGEISITDGAGTSKIDNVWKKSVLAFVRKCQEAIDNL